MAAKLNISSETMTTFCLNGNTVEAWPGETILQTAKRHAVEIPHLCYQDNYRADGNCRACMVEIEGERVLAPSCCRQPENDMVVHTNNERTLHSQRMVLELLLSDMPGQSHSPYKPDSELDQWVEELTVGNPRFEARQSTAADVSHPAIEVNLDACIQCT